MYTAKGQLDRDALIRRHVPLVRRIALHMIAKLPPNVELDDLIQVGMIGLAEALSRFESEQGVQFETFASQRIRGAMLDELREGDWMSRSSRKSQKDIEHALHRRAHEVYGELRLTFVVTAHVPDRHVVRGDLRRPGEARERMADNPCSKRHEEPARFGIMRDHIGTTERGFHGRERGLIVHEHVDQLQAARARADDLGRGPRGLHPPKRHLRVGTQLAWLVNRARNAAASSSGWK